MHLPHNVLHSSSNELQYAPTSAPKRYATHTNRKCNYCVITPCLYMETSDTPCFDKMAEQALEKLEEQLNCAICLDTYTQPKILQCHHVYCRKCLVKLVVRNQQGQLTLTCPTCRKVTPIPDYGVSGLQSAFHIDHLLEIRNSLEKVQDSAVAKERVGGEATGITPEERVILKCSQHTDKELEVYCETCEEVICFECLLTGGKHQGHDSITLKTAFDKYQGEITSSLEPIEKQLMTINSALAQLDTRREEISNKRAAVEDNIHNTFRRLHQILDVRKTKLIGDLHQMTQSKLKDLTAQRDQIETTQAQLSSCLDFMRESLRKGRQEEVLMRKNTIAKLVKELTATYCQPDTLKPNTETDMTFSASSDMSTLCQNYGRIISPSKCYMKDMTEVARVGEKTTALLQAVNSRNEPCEEAATLLECELVSEIRGSIVKGSVERRGKNQYEISYQPTMKGRHQLHIKVEGHHIRGSPFTVAVTAPVEKLGTPIQAIQLDCPLGVAIHQNGEIIATSDSKHFVSVFSLGGEELRSFGTRGSAQGQFNLPINVAVDGEGNILVADLNNHHIQKFTADGHFLTAVGTEGNGPLQFKGPLGITFNASNNKVYVADRNNHHIQVLNSDLTFTSTYGKFGSGRGQFNHPEGIACDSTGKVYVADSYNDRIQVFTPNGEFLRMFGRHGQGRGELSTPISVAVDTSDRVYVSEGGRNHRVSVFTSEGRFLTSFGKKGKEPGEFHNPIGLAVDSSGVVYVCDFYNNRIQLF